MVSMSVCQYTCNTTNTKTDTDTNTVLPCLACNLPNGLTKNPVPSNQDQKGVVSERPCLCCTPPGLFRARLTAHVDTNAHPPDARPLDGLLIDWRTSKPKIQGRKVGR